MVFFGIDYLLIVVYDFDKVIEIYCVLGFFIVFLGQYFWGILIVLVLFCYQIIEIVSIGDEILLDGYEVGGFCFG